MKNNFDCLFKTMMGMTYEEVETAVKNNAIVLFPVGVVEAQVRIFRLERIFLLL